jgi:hypothetical protein
VAGIFHCLELEFLGYSVCDYEYLRFPQMINSDFKIRILKFVSKYVFIKIKVVLGVTACRLVSIVTCHPTQFFQSRF